MVVGFAESVHAGDPTVTHAVACALPPGPSHVTVYAVVEDGETVVVPDVRLPGSVENPSPSHFVAFVEPHVKVDDWP